LCKAVCRKDEKGRNRINTTTIESDIIQEGWKVLVAKLGLQKATQFVILLERGKGDSVKEINEYWGNAGIEEIYDRVADWKASRPF
jgi:hypothetical protein